MYLVCICTKGTAPKSCTLSPVFNYMVGEVDVSMRTRETYFKDYGISETEAKELRAFCAAAADDDKPIILNCCIEANSSLADDLYFSITQGLGYDTLSRVKVFLSRRGIFMDIKGKP